MFFLGWRNLAKFQPEKYDVNLYKGFPMKRMAQIHQIFYDKFQLVAKNIERFFFFSFFHI
jgi:hypothetical protein